MYNMWNAASIGPVRALRLSYTLGIGIASLVALPFLWEKPSQEWPFDVQQTQSNDHHCKNRPELNNTVLRKMEKGLSHVQVAYFIIALTGFLLSIAFFCLPVSSRSTVLDTTLLDTTLTEKGKYTKEHHRTFPDITSYYKVSIYTFFMIFTAAFGGAEITFTGLMISYSYDFLGWGKKEGIIMSALYQMTKFVFALVGIFLSYKLPATVMLFFNSLVVSLTTAFLLATISCEGHTSMWICTLCLAIGNSSLFPSCLAWIGNKHNLWRKLPRLFNMSFCTGVMILPYLTAHLLVTYGYKYLPWVLLVCSGTGFLMYLLLLALLECWPYLAGTQQEIEPLIPRDPEHPTMWAI